MDHEVRPATRSDGLYVFFLPPIAASLLKLTLFSSDWNSLIKKHSLGPSFRFSHSFTSSTWDAATQSHTCVFSRPGLPDLVAPADVIISAAGALNTPIFPKLDGMDSFLGKQFHSSRWEEDVDLRGKRVAIVGNGSSGIQVVPNVVGLEGIQITQFFRSPGYFTPKVRFVPPFLQCEDHG